MRQKLQGVQVIVLDGSKLDQITEWLAIWQAYAYSKMQKCEGQLG